ncbi:MAG: YncE family protein [Methanosarcina sp.]
MATNTATISNNWDKTQISTYLADIANYRTGTYPVTGITDKICIGNTGEANKGIVIDDDIKVSVNLDKANVYKVNFYDNTVSVIDNSTKNVIATIPVGKNPIELEISQDGSKLYTANSGSYDISVINTTTNTVMDTLPAKGKPVGVGTTPDGKVYVIVSHPRCVERQLL